jgi:hypothetical protein
MRTFTCRSTFLYAFTTLPFCLSALHNRFIIKVLFTGGGGYYRYYGTIPLLVKFLRFNKRPEKYTFLSYYFVSARR